MTEKRLQVLMLTRVPGPNLLIHRQLKKQKRSHLRVGLSHPRTIETRAKMMRMREEVGIHRCKRRKRRKKLCQVPTTMKLSMDSSKKIAILEAHPNSKMIINNNKKYLLVKMRII